MPRVIRKLTWFRKGGERLAGEAPLRGITLRELRRLFARPASDPMYDCFPVSAEQASRLQAHVDHPIRLDRYDYFVEADAATMPAKTLAER